MGAPKAGKEAASGSTPPMFLFRRGSGHAREEMSRCGGKKTGKRNRRKAPGSKYRRLAVPEDLEPRAAPSESLVGA